MLMLNPSILESVHLLYVLYPAEGIEPPLKTPIRRRDIGVLRCPLSPSRTKHARGPRTSTKVREQRDLRGGVRER